MFQFLAFFSSLISGLPGAAAVDWEDIASFEKGGKPWLLIADAGDNDARRKDYALYIVPEPAASQRAAATKQTVRAALAIRFTFEDGPHDCESVAVCTQTSQILLVTKPFQAECGAYSLPLVGQKPDEPLVARKLAVLPVPIPVAMDVSPDGLRAIILTYGDAFEYARGRDETWAQAFARKPRQLHMPRRGQGEAICYGSDGKTLYLTSEGSPCPLFEVPVADGK